MTEQKTFKIQAPVGNIVVPKNVMNDAELRDFALQLIQDDGSMEVWREKVEKDELSEVLAWLRGAGFTVEEA